MTYFSHWPAERAVETQQRCDPLSLGVHSRGQCCASLPWLVRIPELSSKTRAVVSVPTWLALALESTCVRECMYLSRLHNYPGNATIPLSMMCLPICYIFCVRTVDFCHPSPLAVGFWAVTDWDVSTSADLFRLIKRFQCKVFLWLFICFSVCVII